MIQLVFPTSVMFGVTYQHMFMGWLVYMEMIVWLFCREHALTRSVFPTQDCLWVVGVTSQTRDVIWINVNSPTSARCPPGVYGFMHIK